MAEGQSGQVGGSGGDDSGLAGFSAATGIPVGDPARDWGGGERDADGNVSTGRGWFTRPDGSRFRNSKKSAGSAGDDAGGTGKSKSAKSEKAAVSGDLTGIADIIVSIHEMLVLATNVPELAMDAEDAAKLEKAAKLVAKHYKVPVTAKQLDMAMALKIIASVYGTRFVAYNMRRRIEAGQRKAQAQDGAPGVAQPNVIFGGFGAAPPAA